jgi:predicted transcriptional regulator
MAEPARPMPDDDETAAFVKAVQEGVAVADASQTVPYEAVRRWLLSWGTEAELPPPPCP